MHILLLEPDRKTAQTAAAYLDAHHTVTAVSTAQAAIHALDDDTIDLVVMELSLPEHNGIEFLYELRSYADLRTKPVILFCMNAVRPAEAEQLVTQLGVLAICQKGFTTLKQLTKIIEDSAVSQP